MKKSLIKIKIKLNFFNPQTLTANYIDHDSACKCLAWDINGLTNINYNDIDNFDYIKSQALNKQNIKSCAKKIIEQFNYNNNKLTWMIEKFLQSLIESTTLNESIKVYYSSYISYNEHFVIRNDKIIELFNTLDDYQKFIDCLNTLPYFKNKKLNLDDIFRTEKNQYLQNYLKQYTVISNMSYCDSNITQDSINYDYRII